MNTRAFTEKDVGEFFDQTLKNYLSFWDGDGVLHTGYFDAESGDDYLAAARRTSEILAAEAGIGASSEVLDVGCGCGNFLIFLAERYGCRGVGLDLSGERIAFARQQIAGRNLPVSFTEGSATRMPYESGTFSHAVSQDALFLVPDKPLSHAEIHRVLRPGGTLAVTDFLQPREEISERARRHVYDRVRWSGGYSFAGYQKALGEAGFEIITAQDLGRHIRRTYQVLGVTARTRADEQSVPTDARDWMLAFAESCDQIQIAIDDGEFGWGLFVARKRDDGRSR